LIVDLDNAVARPDGQPALECQSKQSSLTGIPIGAEHSDLMLANQASCRLIALGETADMHG